ELRKYNPQLSERPQIVAANKSDIAQDKELIKKFKAYMKKHGHTVFEISAATNKGVKELIEKTAQELAKLPPVVYYEPDYVPKQRLKGSPEELVIENFDDVWTIEGEWVERLMQNVNFSDYESRMFFDRILRSNGVFKRLEDLGIKDGDTVSIYNMEFDYEG
ncbi:MAG: Obg family GTPase CgtA, partial [Oscillospiraceae bacterium]|nr:Obg family GTPase CgtA [Oscillospiraceae bacterium]